MEPNDNIASANDSQISSELDTSTIIPGNISSARDIDLYKIQANQGTGIILNIDTADQTTVGLDSVLRLFDQAGNELGFNDDGSAPDESFSLDSYLSFIADRTAEYYVGVSSAGNLDYDPIDSSQNTDLGDSVGEYSLAIDLIEVIPEDDPDDTISEAISIEVDSVETDVEARDSEQPITPITINEEIDVGRDIDLYQIELASGEGLSLDIDAMELGSELDSQLRLFDNAGNELASSDDNPALDEELSTDSFLTYTPAAPGDYYIGVSTARNSTYDPIYGRTNLLETDSTNNGEYQLNVEVVDLDTEDDDPDNTISEAAVSKVDTTRGIFSSVVTDSINPRGDVDVWELNLESGTAITFNLDAAKLDTDLDAALGLFDNQGREIATSDDAAAPGENPATIDSYLEYTVEVAAPYYLAISGFPNVDYDITDGRNSLEVDAENFSVGDYQLTTNVFNDLRGTDKADVLDGNNTNTRINSLAGNDWVTGGRGNDYFQGGAGDDTLSGNNGDDTLFGGAGSDSLSGGMGADVLQGDAGADEYRGGAGADIFVINEAKQGTDLILDFTDGTDQILLVNQSKFRELEVRELPSSQGITIFNSDGDEVAQVLGISMPDFDAEDLVSGVDRAIE